MISQILCHPRWYHSGCGFAKVHPEHKLIMRFPQFLQVLGPQPNLFQRLWIGCKAERWPGTIPRARTFWDMSTMTFGLFSPTRMKRLTEQNHANINHHCERVIKKAQPLALTADFKQAIMDPAIVQTATQLILWSLSRCFQATCINLALKLGKDYGRWK